MKPHLPFCSPRCKQIDLGRWLREAYSLPHRTSEEDEEPDESYSPESPGDDEDDN